MDVRWIQRLSQYELALSQLKSAVEISRVKNLSDLEKQGLIKSFEYCHELAWNLMKDFFAFQGNFKIMGSRDATKEAFAAGLIADGQTWMKMIESRNLTAHTYNQDTAKEILQKIVNSYFQLFIDFQNAMNKIKNEQN